MRLPLPTARRLVKSHRPTAGRPVCPECTANGVGNHQGEAEWPCTPYREARRVLVEAGEMRPLPSERT